MFRSERFVCGFFAKIYKYTEFLSKSWSFAQNKGNDFTTINFENLLFYIGLNRFTFLEAF